MNNNRTETKNLIKSLKELKFSSHVRVMIAPAFIHLAEAEEMTSGSIIEVIAQNMNAESGAFTGEISAGMLQSIGVKVILGHSERRSFYNESDESLKDKVSTALKNDMEFIFCFGEQLSDRKSNSHF